MDILISCFCKSHFYKMSHLPICLEFSSDIFCGASKKSVVYIYRFELCATFHSSCCNYLKIPGSHCYFGGRDDMPRKSVVILLPYCMTMVIEMSNIVNGGIKTYSVIYVPHSNAKDFDSIKFTFQLY
jgi:hypothetical protein